MSRTRVQLRQALSWIQGDYWASTITADGSTTVLKDNALKNKFQEWINENAYFLATSGTNNINSERRCVEFMPDEGQVEIAYALTDATATDDTYEIHRSFTPSEKHEALNKARIRCFPVLRQDIEDDRITSGDISSNGDFSKWTATTEPDDWVRTNCSALEETTIKWGSGSACKLTSTSAAAYLKQDLITTPLYPYLEIGDTSITFIAFVYCDTADEARIGIEHPSGTITYSDYHSGSKQWEKLDVTVSIDDPEVVNLVCAITSNSVVAYFDHTYAYSGKHQIAEYDLTDIALIGPPQQVLIEGNDENPYCSYSPLTEWVVSPDEKLRFTRIPTNGYKIRIIGQKYLSELTAETSTMEINEDGEAYLCCAAQVELYKMRRGKADHYSVDNIDRSLAYWLAEESAAQLKYLERHPLPPVKLKFPTPV